MLVQDFFSDWPDAFTIARAMGLDQGDPTAIVRISDRLSAGLWLPLVDLFSGEQLTCEPDPNPDQQRAA